MRSINILIYLYHFLLKVLLILRLRVLCNFCGFFLLKYLRFICVVRSVHFIIWLFAFKFLIILILLIIKRIVSLIQISSIRCGFFSTLHHLFPFKCIKSSKKYYFKVIFIPVSWKKLKKSLEWIETHGNMITLEIYQKSLKSLKKFIFYFVILPFSFFKVRMWSRQKWIRYSIKRQLTFSFFSWKTIIQFFNNLSFLYTENRDYFF